jgi:pyrroline-5-carboxylate reductase
MKPDMKKYRILMIGCGKMGGALLAQWIKSDALHVTVVDPNTTNLPEEVISHTQLADVQGKAFDVLVVAIKPQLVDVILPEYRTLLSEQGIVLSMAAGCSVARLSSTLNTDKIVRIMPNLPAFIAQGMSGLFASAAVSEEYKVLSEHMMGLTGGFVWVEDEDGIDRITAVAGSGPGYIFEFARTYIEAAISLGFTENQAHDLVLGTMAGTIEMARQSDHDLETLRNNVTSKNGTTEAGLKALNGDQGLSERMKLTVEAAMKRAIELR